MIPTFLGAPYYPGGFPVPFENLLMNGESLKDQAVRYYEGEASETDVENLKEYVIYYIGAPCFIFKFDNEKQEQYFKTKLSLDDMLDLLLDAGLDPL